MSVKIPEQLPEPRRRDRRAGRQLCTISLEVEVVTPILGGASQARELDEVDVIRVPTVRGHLRFWWRALCGLESKQLHVRESELWGCAATDDAGSPARSPVQIRAEVRKPIGATDNQQILLYDSPKGKKTSGAYALWPAREPLAPRRNPGMRFRLVVVAPNEQEAELRNVIRAWLLFGGYGSRTRRGLGSFQVMDNARAWLPAKPTREAFAACFGRDIFAAPLGAAGDTPRLTGAALHVGTPSKRAIETWTAALGWLNEFRQGTGGASPARNPDPSGGSRPSISNWPEADKIRHLRRKTRAHPPRHNATPAWPRAGFGLPIIGQFQDRARDGGRLEEPDKFELCWRSTGREHDRSDAQERDRLASPLIVKALPLADGTFVPCALWLHRAFPKGEVVVRGVAGSGAPFDRLVAPGDAPRFAAIAGKASLREAFLDWLVSRHKTLVVAP